jgi:signal recognition particle subunit SRP54
MPKMPRIPGMPSGYTPPGTKPQPKLSPGMMQNSLAQGMPDLGNMPGMPELPQGFSGEGKKQLSKKTLAERKKKKQNKKQRKKR